MRLYRLELQAIGPFAGHHTIDFAALGRSGLFLLEGPTGAGKSTLIDAVVFALYGGLAGAESSKQRLHSHHADPGVEPFVDLVFEVEAGLFRIRRTPAHERLKKRGTGTTPVNAQVVLTRLHDVDRPDDGAVVTTRNEDAGLEIEQMVGLSRTQFLQTVVLPQGEFATFLRSSGEDRKKLLEKIFRTDVYERLTTELVDRRRAAQQTTESARIELDKQLEVATRVAEVEGHLDPDALTVEVEQQHARAEADVEAARTTLAAATSALGAAETTAAALARRAGLIERGARLDAAQPAVDEAVDRIAVARRAAAVAPYRDAARATAATLDDAVAAHAQATEAAPVGLDPADCDTEVDRLTAELRDLVDLARLQAELGDRRAALQEVEGRRAELVGRRAAVLEHLDAQPARRAEVDARLDALRSRLADRGGLTAALGQAETGLLAARDAERAQTELAEAAAVVKKFAGDATAAAVVLHDVQVSRIRGMAGELASQLVVGESCMVCGSESHPHPATRGSDHVDQHQVDVAQKHVDELTAALDEARTAHVVVEQQVTHLRERAGGLDVAAATAHRDAAASALAALDQVQTDHDATVAELEQVDADTETSRAHVTELDGRLATLVEQIRQAADELEADQAKVAVVASVEPIELTIDRLEVERLAIRDLRDATARRTSAERAASIAAADLTARLVEHAFSSTDDVDRAAMATPDLERLEHQVTAHREDRARVDEGWADPAVASLTGNERPDVEAARAARETAAVELDAAVGRATVAARRRAQVLSALSALAAATSALAEAEADSAAVIRLAGLADASSPENLKKLTLGTYVLLRRFDDVVAAANERLVRMSGSRYTLRVTDQREKSSSGRRTGLAMAVVDADTGQEREPRTLSGGEQFYFAVSLALGLADVVRAESGGVRLGTLFVDEGFGSLDSEKLDVVMDEFTQLAAGGRSVGLVSHVEELKQRVADRIEVRRQDDGVSTLQVLA